MRPGTCTHSTIAQVEANKVRSYKLYSETAWHDSPMHLRDVSLPTHAVGEGGGGSPKLYHNRARRVQFDAVTMGMKVGVGTDHVSLSVGRTW